MEDPQSVFVETFGATPLVKTIDFFLMYDGFDYSKCQVAEETGVARMTMDAIWDRLIKMNFIVKTRVVGRAEMYKLNRKNPSVKALIDFDLKISWLAAQKEMLPVKA